MRVNLPFCIFYIFLIKYISSELEILNETIDNGFAFTKDFGQFGAAVLDEPLVINCIEHNLDEKLYIKLSGKFSHYYIEYIFSNNANYLRNQEYSDSDLEIEYPIDFGKNEKADDNEERYYIIKKPPNYKESIQNWNYLALLTYMNGDKFYIQISNETITNEDKEKKKIWASQLMNTTKRMKT